MFACMSCNLNTEARKVTAAGSYRMPNEFIMQSISKHYFINSKEVVCYLDLRKAF